MERAPYRGQGFTVVLILAISGPELAKSFGNFFSFLEEDFNDLIVNEVIVGIFLCRAFRLCRDLINQFFIELIIKLNDRRRLGIILGQVLVALYQLIVKTERFREAGDINRFIGKTFR